MTDRERGAYMRAALEEVARVYRTSASNVAYMISDRYPGEYHGDRLVTTDKDLLKYAVEQTFIRLQVEDILVTNWIVAKDNDYRKALNDLTVFATDLEKYSGVPSQGGCHRD